MRHGELQRRAGHAVPRGALLSGIQQQHGRPLSRRRGRARHRARARYVVAIRGTNPVSAFDWLFGDFWACQVMQWPFTTEPAAVSLSSALGLAVLQRLRSERLDGASGGPLGAIVKHAAALSEMAKGH